jgi:hypothetical protein
VADRRHAYSIRVDWIGNQGTGTSAYHAYSRAANAYHQCRMTEPKRTQRERAKTARCWTHSGH